MKKLFILLFFAVNIALGQSVTISPTDASHLTISKFEGTAKLKLVGITNGTNINGHSEISMFNNSFVGSSATSTIKFNDVFSIKHTFTPNPPFDVNTLGIFYYSTPFLSLNPSTTKLETVPIGVSHSSANLLNLTNTTALANGVSNEMYFKTGSYFTGAIKSIGTGSAFARMGFFTFTDASASNLVERLSINDGGNVGIGVTNPIAKLHVDGNIRSSTLAGIGVRNVSADANGTLVITSPQTSYYNIPSQSFRAEVSANSTTDISGRATLISGNSGWLEAPVQLPHGATVTSVKVYFMDNEASKGLDIKFFYKRMDGSLTGAIGQINYIGSSATELLQTIPVSGGVATIDNQNNWYHIGIRVLNDGAGESTWTNNLAVRGILISYTIPN